MTTKIVALFLTFSICMQWYFASWKHIYYKVDW